MVMLDVVVTDNRGKPVGNLSKNDFAIFEDDHEQAIAGFETADQHTRVEVERTLKPKDEGRSNSQPTALTSSAITILVFDELDTHFLDSAYARHEISKFLDLHGPRLKDPTALLALDDKRLEMLHDYTQDATVLAEALYQQPAHRPFELLKGGPIGESTRLRIALDALRQIAAANASFAGRKNVIWIGSGFPVLNSILVDPSDKARALGYVSETSDLLWKSRLAVYTINPAGLQVASGGIDSLFSPAPTDLVFEQLGPQTGGRIFPLLNDVDSMIETSIEDGDSFYAISYYPSNHEWDGKFRRIRVVMRNPELKARTRNGYYADPDATPSRLEVDRLLSSALLSPLPYHSLSVKAHSRFSGSLDQKAHISVGIDANDLSWESLESDQVRCEVTLVATAFSDKGAIVSHGVKELQITLSRQKYEKVLSEEMSVNLAIALPATSVRIRVVVRDCNNGNVGTADLTARGEQFH